MARIGKDIQEAIGYLQNGGLVAIPTETVYGLAANALDPLAVAKIFSVKNRPHFDPLIVHIADGQSAGDLARDIPAVANQLAQRFWPGPLTLVLPRKAVIPDLVTAGLNTVGLRVPNHPLTLELLSRLSFPLAAPSANPFGYVSPTQPSHVEAQLGNAVDYILDGGRCEIGLESTILGFAEERVRLLRRGGLTQEEIEELTGPLEISTIASSNPLAPGQLERHYAPSRRFVLGDVEAIIKKNSGLSIGAITFHRVLPAHDRVHRIVLSPSGSLEEAAKNLFSAIRTMDQLQLDLIVAEEVPDHKLGKAINDRLRRATVQPSSQK
jgi:L-threonylcarbamoyladenylate synthase